jgi:hypothetical protein
MGENENSAADINSHIMRLPFGELLCLLVLVAMCVGVGGDGGVGGIYTEDMLIAVAELQLIEKDLGAPLDRHARS